MKIITSRTNAEIAKVYGLKKAKNRALEHCFIAEGIRTCTTLLQHNVELVSLYATEQRIKEAHTMVNEYLSTYPFSSDAHSIPSPDPLPLTKQVHTPTPFSSNCSPLHLITQVSESVMEKISCATSPSGLLGVFRIPPQQPPEKLTPGLVLANITDGGNMGTLIRSAAACGVNSIVIIEGIDPWSPKVVQASAGAIGAVSLFKWTWQELMSYKKSNHLYALVVSGGASIETVKTDNALLIIGNEAHGLTETQLQDCDHRITLAMQSKTESLNAAVAGSIALYITFVQR